MTKEEEAKIQEEQQRLYDKMISSPFVFIKMVWGLTPQPLKPEYRINVDLGLKLTGKAWDAFAATVAEHWFEPYIAEQHITWQQTVALWGVTKALLGEAPSRISIVSGHGIGKSTLLAWLILWFLFVHLHSQVACTSPSKEQMYDVLWKELKKWIDKMPDGIRETYAWETSHVRMKDAPAVWFARAKTSSKENTEALAGVHADWVLMAVDEACHDDKTEILTDTGWKFFKDLLPKDMVMTLDEERGSAWQRPTKYHEYDHEGEMIASNLRGANFLVTPNHDLYGKTRDKGYRKVKAEKINGTDLFIPRTIKWRGQEDFSDDWMRFVGWFVSEGSFKKYANGKVRSVVISQSKEKNASNYAEIVELIERLGFKPTFSRNDIVIGNATLARKMLQFGDGFKAKHLPDQYRQQSPRLLSIFLDAFVKGDGYSRRNRDILYTSSPRLADNLQEIILKTGFNSTVTKRKLTGKRNWVIDHWGTSSCDGYVVSRSYGGSHIKLNHKKIKRIHYTGKVYCVTVPNGVVLTRRGGCAMWSGNSGVEEPIFETMEGALTSGRTLVFLISNGTRNIGYFYDTHHKDKERWQCFAFNAEESPRVDASAVAGWKDKYGEDSVQYHIRVLGHFPDEGTMDDKGYVQLFNENDLRLVAYDHEWKPVGRVHAGLDPSGEGQDSSEWAIRDRLRAAIVYSEKESTSQGMASKSVTLCDKFEVDPIDFSIDAFGVGHAISQEIALLTSQQKRPWRVNPVNMGDQCDDEFEKELYVNKRAMCYYKFMLWCRGGSEIMDSPGLKDELLSIRFKRTGSGRIQIMDKVQMKKLGFKSPNKADALSMTFLRPDGISRRGLYNQHQASSPQFDPFSPLGS